MTNLANQVGRINTYLSYRSGISVNLRLLTSFDSSQVRVVEPGMAQQPLKYVSAKAGVGGRSKRCQFQRTDFIVYPCQFHMVKLCIFCAASKQLFG